MTASRVTSTIVRIQATPTVVAERLLASLAAEGVTGSVIATSDWFEVEVPGADEVPLVRRVAAALDRLALTEARSLIPERTGPTSFVLRPAAG